jgi:hypothetical protein
MCNKCSLERWADTVEDDSLPEPTRSQHSGLTQAQEQDR